MNEQSCPVHCYQLGYWRKFKTNINKTVAFGNSSADLLQVVSTIHRIATVFFWDGDWIHNVGWMTFSPPIIIDLSTHSADFHLLYPDMHSFLNHLISLNHWTWTSSSWTLSSIFEINIVVIEINWKCFRVIWLNEPQINQTDILLRVRNKKSLSKFSAVKYLNCLGYLLLCFKLNF